MWIKFLLGIAGVCAGGAVTVAELSFVNAIGVYPRLAAKSKTGKYVVLYENLAAAGLFLGSVISIFNFSINYLILLLPVVGFFMGCFVGNLIMGLAEVIDVFPILFRRTRLKEGLSLFVVTVATGKLVGSLCYFFMNLWK